jgi:hypothetical protein
VRRTLVPAVLLSLAALPAVSVAGSSTTADRFERIARQSRASGTLTLTMRFRADPERCRAEGTCGLSGTVTTRLRLDQRRAVRVRDDVVVLPVRGTARGTTRDEAGARACNETAQVRTAGVVFTGDRRGVLLRPGAAPDDAGIEDPFSTGCRAPRLADLGRRAVPPLRLRRLNPAANRITMRFRATRQAAADGFDATVTTRGTVRLNRR